MSKTQLYLVNALTLSRFVLAAVIIYLALAEMWAGVVVCTVLAFLSDWADGWLARRWQAVSAFGKFFDPLSDKAVCLAVLWLAAAYYGTWPYITGAVLISLYDSFTVGMRLMVKRTSGTMIQASKQAKAKTILLMVSLIFISSGIAVGSSSGAKATQLIGLVLLGGAVALSVRALVQYIKQIPGRV